MAAQKGSIAFSKFADHAVLVRVDFNDGRIGSLIASDAQIGEMIRALESIRYDQKKHYEVFDLEVSD